MHGKKIISHFYRNAESVTGVVISSIYLGMHGEKHISQFYKNIEWVTRVVISSSLFGITKDNSKLKEHIGQASSPVKEVDLTLICLWLGCLTVDIWGWVSYSEGVWLL